MAKLPVAQEPQVNSDQPQADQSMAGKIADRLFGLNGVDRYQLWPERVVRSAVTAPGDVLNSPTPVTSDELVKRAVDMSALAGTGGLAGVGEDAGLALGAGPFLRPALKYGGKIYKAPIKDSSNPLFFGSEHADALGMTAPEVQREFMRQAMSGNDISNFNFGFMNHKGQFIPREQALDYGIKEGLLSPHDAKFGTLTSTMGQ